MVYFFDSRPAKYDCMWSVKCIVLKYFIFLREIPAYETVKGHNICLICFITHLCDTFWLTFEQRTSVTALYIGLMPHHVYIILLFMHRHTPTVTPPFTVDIARCMHALPLCLTRPATTDWNLISVFIARPVRSRIMTSPYYVYLPGVPKMAQFFVRRRLVFICCF